MSSVFVYVIGFLAQGFFSARMLIQWVMSERQKRVVSPSLFWICSLAGSILLCIYGILRDDFAIVFGQFISYYIYIWNLDIKGLWRRMPLLVRALLFSLPAVAATIILSDGDAFFQRFFQNEHVPLWMLIYGSAGQVIFTVRFIYQWWYSHRLGSSELPLGFWLISLTGCFIIVSYGLFRLDPVLVLGQSVGFITYTRNIFIYFKQKR
ncbi:MAG: lipid-A-disaccharide synthase N-terminal domain-containing protein [Bacteroidaceae bacterium]|nr:lipid-A-disaccharide synthase N-terminal domain-containing protein [Bacteroidaceae bacterium]